MSKKKLLKYFYSLCGLYLIIGATLYYSQQLFLFHNKPLALKSTLNINCAFNEKNFNWLEGKNFNLISLLTKDSCKGLVLYLHGNKNNVERYAPYTNIFTKHGYEVWMPDYPTFGKTTGALNEANLYKAVLLAYDSMVAAKPNLPIIIYGKSLGTGLANYVASLRTCQQVILETPYYSIPTLFNAWVFIYPMNWLAKYDIPSYKYFLAAQKPTTIFHGTNDWVIPYRNAAMFKNILKATDTFITIEGANHVSINNTTTYLNKMEALLK